MRCPDRSKIQKLSNNAKTVFKNLEWSVELAELDDIYSAERCDLKSDLNAVMLDRRPWFLEKKEVLKSLSLATTLQGQLIENLSIQKVLAKVNSEWIKARSMCLMGNTSFKKYIHKPPKRIIKTNKSTELCKKYFDNEMRIFLKKLCTEEGNISLVDYFLMDSCDITIKNRLNEFNKKLTEHFRWTTEAFHKQSTEMQKPKLPKISSKLQKPDSHVTRLPKISDFTKGIIGKVVAKKPFSAYDHLNNQYSTRIENSIKDMGIQVELEKIIQKETFDLQQAEIDDNLKQKYVHGTTERGLTDFKDVDVDSRSYKDELEEILNIQLESLLDEKISQLTSHGSLGTLKTKFEAFNKDYNLETPNENTLDDSTYNQRLKRSLRESPKSKSFTSAYYEDGDGRDKMKVVYDETMSNDDEIDYKRGSNYSHIIVGDMFDKRRDGVSRSERDNEKSKREYDEKRFTKESYKSYYMEDEGKEGVLYEIKKRRKRGINEGRKKRKKDDKKHKKKKKNKHKEREALGEKEDDKRNKLSIFMPNNTLYSDSQLSFCIDVYQFKGLTGHECITQVLQQAPMTKLDVNFSVDFDLTQAPSMLQDTPLMRMFLDTSTGMHATAESISNLKDFNIDTVNHKNAFLWSLLLTSFENLQSSKASIMDIDSPNTPQGMLLQNRKLAGKAVSNPLIQAFKQAVEANKNKQKDDKHTPAPSALIKPSKYLLMGNMGSGLSGLFRLQSNLKAGTRDMVKEVTETFQKDLQKFLRKQTFLHDRDLHSSSLNCDFSDSLHHFQSISKFSQKLYTEAEFKLSQREELLKYKQQYNKYGTYTLTSTANVTADNTSSTTHKNSTSTPSTTNTKSMLTYYDSVSVPARKGQISVAKAAAATSIPALTASNTLHSNYNFYSTYHHPYNWTYMPPYTIPSYPPGYFHPFYSHYPPMSQHYPPYNFPTTQPIPPLPTLTTSSYSDSSQSKHFRFHVFMVGSPETLEVEKHLENSGQKRFDVHNISLLNYTGNFECQVLIHHNLLPSIHHVPNLLNLKRDPRVTFYEFDGVDDVIEKKYRLLFPRGGVVLVDLSVLLSCQSDVLESLCKHLSSAPNNESPWSLVTSRHVFSVLQTLRSQLKAGNEEEQARLEGLFSVLSTYQCHGLLHLMEHQHSPQVSDLLCTQAATYEPCNSAAPILPHPPTETTTEQAPNPPSDSLSDHPPNQSPEKPSNQSPDQPPNQLLDQSSEQPSDQPPEQPANQPPDQSPDQPSDQPPDQPANQPPEQPSDQSPDQPSDQPANQPPEQPSDQSPDQPSDQPPEQPANQPPEQPSDQSPDQPPEQLTNQPPEQQSDQPANQPPEQPSDQPANQPPDQPSYKSSDQLINQALNQIFDEPPKPPNQTCIDTTFESSRHYYNYLLNFQASNLHTYRHFVFLSDLARTHPDTQLFLSGGMEVFGLVEFMHAFASKSVHHQHRDFEGFTRAVTSQVYMDAPLSLCSQSISF